MGDRVFGASEVKSKCLETEKNYEELYRVYEYADGLCFPDYDYRCGKPENYVQTGILTEDELREILNDAKA